MRRQAASNSAGRVGPDDPAARGEKRRLEDARVARPRATAARGPSSRENTRWRGEGAPPRERRSRILPLCLAAATAAGRVVRQPEGRRDRRRRDDRVLVDADDGRDRRRPRELDDAPRAGRRVAEVEREEPVRIERFERARLLRGDGDVDAERRAPPRRKSPVR